MKTVNTHKKVLKHSKNPILVWILESEIQNIEKLSPIKNDIAMMVQAP